LTKLNQNRMDIMSEQGKNIIIDFTEKEESIYKPPGKLEQLKVTGEASVINLSDKHRLWNILLSLKGLSVVKSELTDQTKVGEINAKAKWAKSYEVKNEEIQTKTLLKLTEIIDCYYEKPTVINWALVKDHQMPVSFTISLENTADEATVSKIKLIKNLPKELGDPIIDPPAQGDVRFDQASRNIIWEGFNLVPGGIQSLIVRVGFKPTRIEPYNSGNIEVHYVVPEKTRSRMTGTTNALSDSMFAIDQGECLDTPGEWECTAEFENSSDFDVELKKAKVLMTSEGRKDTVLEESLSKIVTPNTSWKKDFKVKSKIVPKFSNIHEFNVVPKVTSKVIGHIVYQAGVLPVAHITAEKIIDPPTVSAYTKTPMKVSLVLTNAGSAVLDEIDFHDVIPADFQPPELNEVTASIGEEELRGGILREMEPNDANPETSHALIVQIGQLAQAGGLQPGEQLLITYPLTAWEPKPNTEYRCPLNISANVDPPGPPTKIPTIESQVEVKYVRRRIRAIKGQTPGAEPGEYIIPIVFENKGEVLIENITIKDIIPSNFQLLDYQPKGMKPEIEENERGTKLTWKLDKCDPGEKYEFSYTIKGSGEYEREELEVIVK
jgi:hypothetical protein